MLFRHIFAFFSVVHGTREVIHFDVTRCPTDAWAAQQLTEATPDGDGPTYLIRDNDDKFGRRVDAVAERTSIDAVKIPQRSPNLNALCERFPRSASRECLDHVVIFSERQLYRVLLHYVEIHFNRDRPHQGLFQKIPALAASRSVSEVDGTVSPISIRGGLHHEHQRATWATSIKCRWTDG